MPITIGNSTCKLSNEPGIKRVTLTKYSTFNILQLIIDGAIGGILISLPFQSNVLLGWIGSPLDNQIQKQKLQFNLVIVN